MNDVAIFVKIKTENLYYECTEDFVEYLFEDVVIIGRCTRWRFFYWKLLFLKTEMRLGIERKGNSLYSSRLFVTNRFHGV